MDKEFEAVPLPADCVPAEICATCATGAIFDHVAQVVVAYCRHSCCGAVLPLGEKWHLTEGVARTVFREQVEHQLAAKRLLMARKDKAN